MASFGMHHGSRRGRRGGRRQARRSKTPAGNFVAVAAGRLSWPQPRVKWNSANATDDLPSVYLYGMEGELE